MPTMEAEASQLILPGVAQDPPFRFNEIHLELTTACNFRCGFCPLTDLHRPHGRLEFETAERVLRECIDNKLTRHATFHLMGEALLHPRCMDVLRLCRQIGIETRLVTNGSNFKREKFVELFNLVDRLDISYRTVDDMEFQSVNKKLTFQEYLDLILSAIDLRASMPESDTQIRLRVFISEKTIPSLRDLCLRLKVNPDAVIGAKPGVPVLYDSFTPLPWLSFLCEDQLDWIGTTKKYPSKYASCDEFETGFAVLSDGQVTTCCWDAHGGNAMGNVNEKPLTEILFSEAAESFRSQFKKHTCPTETCQACRGRPSFIKSKGYQALVILGQR